VLLDKLREAGVDVAGFPDFDDRGRWSELRSRFAAVFAQRTRGEWSAALEGTDGCFAPVLSPREAPSHPHHRARHGFITVAGITQPAPAPRFGATPAGVPSAPGADGDAREWARAWGLGEADLAAALESREGPGAATIARRPGN
jgi:alpha-methylacyl-CoA racemase